MMGNTRSSAVLIAGLGRFGSALGNTLVEMGHEVLGVGGARPGVLLGGDEGALGHPLPRRLQPAELHGPVPLGLDQGWVQQSTQDDEAVVVPLLGLLGGQHRRDSSETVEG